MSSGRVTLSIGDSSADPLAPRHQWLRVIVPAIQGAAWQCRVSRQGVTCVLVVYPRKKQQSEVVQLLRCCSLHPPAGCSSRDLSQECGASVHLQCTVGFQCTVERGAILRSGMAN